MAETIKIGGELESTATGNKVADIANIKDKTKGNKSQAEINAETEAAIQAEIERAIDAENNRYTKSETYNKSELNNMITTPNQQYVTVTATDQTTSVTDVLPATGSANTVYRVGNWDGSQFDASVYSEYAWNGSSYVHLSTKTKIGEVFDISAYHATGGELVKYADLAAALDSNNGGGVPQSLQKGGMSVKFVRTYDNKYVQYRLMAQTFTTDVTQWQGVDSSPTEGSKNLVESGSVKTISNSVGTIPLPVVNIMSNVLLLNNGSINYNHNGYTVRMYDCSELIGKTIHVITGVIESSIMMAGFFNSSEPSADSLVRLPDGWNATTTRKNLDAETTVGSGELYLAIITYQGHDFGVYDTTHFKMHKQIADSLSASIENVAERLTTDETKIGSNKIITDLIDDSLVSFEKIENPIVETIDGKSVNTNGVIEDANSTLNKIDVQLGSIVKYQCVHGVDGTAILAGFKDGVYVKTLVSGNYNPAIDATVICDGTYNQVYLSQHKSAEFANYVLEVYSKVLVIDYLGEFAGKTIDFEGDSITEAANDTKKGWAERAGGALKMDWVNNGNSGASICEPPTQPNDTLTSRASILYNVLSRNPENVDYMIISGGYNDAMSYADQQLDYTDYREWVPADDYSDEESYIVDDVVSYNGTLYHCIGATSGTWDSSKWSAISEFSSSTSYSAGDFFTHNGFVYKCINAHSGAFEKTSSQKYVLGDFQLIPAKSDWNINTTIGALEFMFRYATTHFKKVGFILCYGYKANNWNIRCAPKIKEVCEKWGVPCIDLRYTAGFNLYSDDCAVRYGAMRHQGYIPPYPDNAPYTVGTTIKYGGILYETLEAIPANPGPFDPTKYQDLRTDNPADYDHQHCRADGYEKLSNVILEWIKTL